ncbi:1-(5-phosphoribosyl)-5-[(5-phosphoribosylamino)methylideneamino]imidazole-4-carboxamide isomerase [Bythopirellula goksoeyrii]|uniref:1-(5-phosphoribosyl)-5-[(5-phosphoribosylamino)methylideneamino] imidazole-4-carboxamide isomerase n=1 Tax=Bythopirellula goksoeyrii TaxID=1400387 RepID=A0A5B9QGG7_9BACT|nr:1-(5-phosphoribosyl)-5-[(5-phosphoribosylamino)methylideneamino]imidazole-4-carboxamide isomerase [Bythopirellula goksoeyrii]QEG36735.1 1-(5-phosphoribosyl)-5-[(5-phosphoribosylamino)methylideneamino] imidazole-4-carboxamide isomerase [Bythopirellula goksoeyrii]
MQIWPAIDLLGGKCVRLQQGDYGRETVFSDDPVAMALKFQSAGAKYLHLVDLDGARDGQPTNHEIVREIVAAVDMQCELGGGIRSEKTIDNLFATGLHRLVLGTAALDDPDWLREMAKAHPEQLVLGIDARDGYVATHGWLEVSDVRATDLATQFHDVSLAAIIYTDIATDGMLQGPNVPEMEKMQKQVSVPVVASGGVTTIEDVRALADVGLAGAIVGRALYQGTIDLSEAIEVAETGVIASSKDQ